MDYLRSCYQVKMRFRPGGPGVLVQWFFAKPGAKVFPGEHGYYSLNWEDEHHASPVGEDRSLFRPKWVNGQGAALLRGQCLTCVNPVLFGSSGDPSGVVSPVPVTTNGVPVTCLRGKLGGLLLSGKAVVTRGGCIAVCARTGYMASVTAASGIFAPLLGNSVPLVHDPLLCRYTGSLFLGALEIPCLLFCTPGVPSPTADVLTANVQLDSFFSQTVNQAFNVTPFPPVLVDVVIDLGGGNSFTTRFSP